MRLKANYNEIDIVGNFVLSKTEELDKTLKNSFSLIEEISSCWEGPDALTFTTNASTYIKNIDNTVKNLKSVGTLMRKVSYIYKEKDYEWETQIKKVGLIENEK